MKICPLNFSHIQPKEILENEELREMCICLELECALWNGKQCGLIQ